MNKVEIYDPAMCCSTGVCGPGVDPELLRVSAMLNVLVGEGKTILRYGLSENPMAFLMSKVVNDVLGNEGVESLPVTLVDGEIRRKGSYPTNIELATWSGLTEADLLELVNKAQLAS